MRKCQQQLDTHRSIVRVIVLFLEMIKLSGKRYVFICVRIGNVLIILTVHEKSCVKLSFTFCIYLNDEANSMQSTPVNFHFVGNIFGSNKLFIYKMKKKTDFSLITIESGINLSRRVIDSVESYCRSVIRSCKKHFAIYFMHIFNKSSAISSHFYFCTLASHTQRFPFGCDAIHSHY